MKHALATTKKKNDNNTEPKTGGNLDLNKTLNLVGKSIDTFKASFDLAKEKEKTKQIHIECEKEVNLAQKDLAKSQLKHTERLAELDNEKEANKDQHERNMTALTQQGQNLDKKASAREKILDLLASGTISAEEACNLLKALQNQD
ncbi:hypothetical protein [Pelistega europaea]|uniref:Uncharacterized protein n=1 Tax=Pelistega europaea TaxID=106147 RepID=A0A7Y4P4S3_9BURK|nr:hypothetical protein [Pelistega europaea]NOL50367.1 hypothetical protein [Pelistega europaea]